MLREVSMAVDIAALWQGVVTEAQHPDTLWQAFVLACCLGLAKLAEGVVRERTGTSADGLSRARALGRGGLRRLVFPVAGVVLVAISRGLLYPHIHVQLLSLAMSLLGSLAIIRAVFYILRHSFSGAAWLADFERGFALLVWGVVALHLVGVLPDLIKVLDAWGFHVGKAHVTAWQLLQGTAMVLVTVLCALWLGNAAEVRLNRAEGLDDNFRVVLSRLVKALLLVVAVLISLPVVGVDLTTLSVFGGALGVGLGFGLQKIASNYVSGFIILLERSIRLGNVISVGADRGEVTQITTRYTVLRNTTGVESLVPNELLVGSVVQNESYTDHRVRFALQVQVSYECDVEHAMAILVQAAQTQPRVLADPPPAALLTAFAESGINLELGFWIKDPEQGTLAIRSDINLAIWHAFQAAGIGIPYPQRELRIIQGSLHV
jgi:small-conductance mechanosensitive channel